MPTVRHVRCLAFSDALLLSYAPGLRVQRPRPQREGWLVEYNFGRMDGFLQRPTAFANNPGVTLATASTYPIGFYTNLNPTAPPRPSPTFPS